MAGAAMKEMHPILAQLVESIEQNDMILSDESVKVITGKAIGIPEGMTYTKAVNILKRKQKQEQEEVNFDRTFLYRPNDGAYALAMVMKEMFGMTLGKAIQTFFGERPPEMKRIEIAYGKSVQVPWGRIEIPALDNADVYTQVSQHRDYGHVFQLIVNAKRKHRAVIEEMFDRVQKHLEDHSIYRGQAIVGTNEPEFYKLEGFDPESVIYSQDIKRMLEGVLWSPLRFSDSFRRDNIALKRAILLHGHYGCGKTLTGQRTAAIAVQHGWTYIFAKPGRDDLVDALRTARLYEPAVVFYEDVDNPTSESDGDSVSRLLDAFDGATAKGGELIVVMTTNHIERIHKGMLRPGRLDALVEITPLDRAGTEALVTSLVRPECLDKNMDWDAVHEVTEGFYPAFIAEVVNRATSVAFSECGGAEDYVISTSALTVAAETLRPQLQIMDEAQEGEKRPELVEALEAEVQRALHGARIHEPGGEAHPDFLLATGSNGNS